MISSSNSNKWEKFNEESNKPQNNKADVSQPTKSEKALDQERFKSFIADINSIPNLNR